MGSTKVVSLGFLFFVLLGLTYGSARRVISDHTMVEENTELERRIMDESVPAAINEASKTNEVMLVADEPAPPSKSGEPASFSEVSCGPRWAYPLQPWPFAPQPNCGCQPNYAPQPQPNYPPQPNCGCQPNYAPQPQPNYPPQPNCGCQPNYAPQPNYPPQPNPGCQPSNSPQPEPAYPPQPNPGCQPNYAPQPQPEPAYPPQPNPGCQPNYAPQPSSGCQPSYSPQPEPANPPQPEPPIRGSPVSTSNPTQENGGTPGTDSLGELLTTEDQTMNVPDGPPPSPSRSYASIPGSPGKPPNPTQVSGGTPGTGSQAELITTEDQTMTLPDGPPPSPRRS